MPRARSRSGKKIDTVRWAFDGATFQALAAGSIAVTSLGAFSTVVETIMRIRGELLAWIDGTPTPGDLVRVGVGLILAQSGQSTTVLSAPLTDGQASWIWLEQFTLGYDEMVTDVIDVPGITSVRKVIDNKSMRIIRPDQEVQLVAEQATLGTAQAVNISVNTRYLLGH